MTDDSDQLFASLPAALHAVLRERVELLRRRPGPRSRKPECVVIGHAWIDDQDHTGWLICVACDGVKPP